MFEFAPDRDRLIKYDAPDAVPAVDVEVMFRAFPELSEFAVMVSADPVPVVEVRVKSLFVVSHPKPDDSEVIDVLLLKNAT